MNTNNEQKIDVRHEPLEAFDLAIWNRQREAARQQELREQAEYEEWLRFNARQNGAMVLEAEAALA